MFSKHSQLSIFNRLIDSLISLQSESVRSSMSETQRDRLNSGDEQIRDIILSKLDESGEKDRLKDMIREELIKSGWRDEVKDYCKEVIKSKGLDNVTVEKLIADITPFAKSKIPEDVTAELLERIKCFVKAT